MYAFFPEVILTDKEISHVFRYKLHWDDQKTDMNILAHALRSTKASMESTHLFTYITTTKWGDCILHSFTEAFALH